MKGRTKRNFTVWLMALVLSLMLAISLTGCQTAAVTQETAPAAQGIVGSEGQETVPEEMPEDETEEDIEEISEEDGYIDADYVDAHFDEEEEDLSVYSGKSSSGSGGSKRSGNNMGFADEESGEESEGQDEYQTDPVPDGMPEPVEPEDEDVDEDTPLTCTLYVECSTILDNIEDLTEGKEDLVPSDGVIFSRKKVTFYEGESVYDLLLREMQNNRIHMEAEFTPAYNSAYVQGINNLYEKDCGRWSGWMYNVNGWYPNYGCSRYQIQEGDVIEWRYTCDLGRDLGRDMSEYE